MNNPLKLVIFNSKLLSMFVYQRVFVQLAADVPSDFPLGCEVGNRDPQ